MIFFSRNRIWCSVIVVVAILDMAWLLAAGHSFAPGTLSRLVSIFSIAALFTISAYFLRERERLHIFCGGLAILLTAWPVLRVFNHLSLTSPGRLADDRLASWDKFLGFDWHAYVGWIDDSPVLIDMMATTYTGLTVYTCALFVLLLFSNDALKSCSELIALFILTAILCSAIGMLVPAIGPMAYYAPPAGTFTHFDPDVGTYSVPGILERRSGMPQSFDLAHLPGLTTFPSFHTAMGLIAIYCSRRTPWLFSIMLPVNLVMLAGTPIFGSHYLVDLLGGGAVVLLAIGMLRFVPAQRSVKLKPYHLIPAALPEAARNISQA